MSEPFIGEIRMFAGNYAPVGWAFCDGQLLAVSQNDALFSLLGTIYGGDGRTTFGLPEMRGRIPIHTGTGPGLSPRRIGSRAGSESQSVTANHAPAHSHDMLAGSSAGTENSPENSFLASSPNVRLFRPQAPSGAALDAGAIGPSPAGAQPHNNIMPFQCVNFIIALVGTYPSRN